MGWYKHDENGGEEGEAKRGEQVLMARKYEQFVSNKDRWEKVNELVQTVQNKQEGSSDALYELWEMYVPTIRTKIGNWRKFYSDQDQHIIQQEDLEQDCFIWFYHYVMKYEFGTPEIGKNAVFSTYINNVMNMRIRFIYQQQLKVFNAERPLNLSDTQYQHDAILELLVTGVEGEVPSAEETAIVSIERETIERLAKKVRKLCRNETDINRIRDMILTNDDLLEDMYMSGYDIDELLRLADL